MKTHVLIVSQQFPKWHPRGGDPTEFIDAITDSRKIHTIRHNYQLWKKRIDEVQRGEAVLSIRVWTGKPRRSKQHTLKNLSKDDGVGIQKVTIKELSLYKSFMIEGFWQNRGEIAMNDGLSLPDFKDWFDDAKDGDNLALIHFTGFRY